jgi:7-carboxy-7-deazaguanine synthase
LPASRDVAAVTGLRVNEIFLSLQGETTRTGLPTVFVRLTGCPVRCTYCDTDYAFYDGRTLPIPAVLEQVAGYRVHHVTVTGGEPLAQKHCGELLKALCDTGYSVSLETSGALDIARVDPRVSMILDIKTPGSGVVEKNHWPNLARLSDKDEVKFVLTGAADYDWAKDILAQHRLDGRCEVLFSPVESLLPARQLAEWILRDRLPVRMQIQLHRYLWGAEKGR